MDEVAFQEEVVAVLKKSLEGADVSVSELTACSFSARLLRYYSTFNPDSPEEGHTELQNLHLL